MRRIIILGTAVAVLAAASVAVAATLNTYTAGLGVKPNKAGSTHKPVSVGFTQTLTAKNDNAGEVAAPLTDIKWTIYGLVSNASKFPTCDGNKISLSHTDSFCPAKALVATGPVNAELGGTSLSKGSTFSCNPFLHVWNGGHGKLWFFFTTNPAHQCGSLHTGDTAAYPGFIKQQGKNEVTNVPLPPDVSTAVAGHQNLYGSLVKQVLTFKNMTTKVHGKSYPLNESTGCKAGKRPWSVSFTATSPAGSETKVVKGSTKC